MKQSLFVIFCVTLWCAGLLPYAVAGVYRWVDENGQVNYSDTPHPNAEVITLRNPNISKSVSTDSSPQTATEFLQKDGKTMTYTQVVVTSPTADESLWNIGGQLNAKISVQPKLQKNHGLVVFLDGKRINQDPQMNTSFTINNVYRGTHTIRAAVYAKTGEVLLNGPTVTFYVKQNSVIRRGG